MKVLMIDDHAMFREGLTLLLKRSFPEIEIIQERSIAEALERFSLEGENFEFIFTDLLCPGVIDPFIALKALLGNAGAIPVIVISALESEFYVDSALKAGARGYVYKSHMMSSVVGAIHQIGRGRIFRPKWESDISTTVVASRSGTHENGSSLSHVEWCGIAIPNRNCVSTLTPRQHDVLKYLIQGLSNKEIARNLGLFEGTVKIHLKAILRKLGAQNRTQAVVIASRILNGCREDAIMNLERRDAKDAVSHESRSRCNSETAA